jgi:hypothetical protein
MPDFYPTRLSELIAWHANFAAEAAASGATLGLTAGSLANIALDAPNVAILVNYSAAIDAFRQEVTEYRDLVLRGDLTSAIPAPPSAPAGIVLGVGSLLGIELRTRQYAATIKASPNYTQAIGEAYGIVAASSGLSTPTVKAAAMPGTSNVGLKIGKGGHAMIAIDMQRGGGAWTELQRVGTANYTDTTAALVPGQPEQRNYRVQGVVGNDRVGDLSDVSTVVTAP